MSKGRRKARETAFLIIFERLFCDDSLEDIIESAKISAQGEKEDDPVLSLIINPGEFTLSIVTGTQDNLAAIDELIKDNLVKWDMNRISKVALCLLRMAIFEMLFLDDVPVSVSINEAVELAKKYAADDDPAFINGLLGAVSRGMGIVAYADTADTDADTAEPDDTAKGQE